MNMPQEGEMKNARRQLPWLDIIHVKYVYKAGARPPRSIKPTPSLLIQRGAGKRILEANEKDQIRISFSLCIVFIYKYNYIFL